MVLTSWLEYIYVFFMLIFCWHYSSIVVTFHYVSSYCWTNTPPMTGVYGSISCHCEFYDCFHFRWFTLSSRSVGCIATSTDISRHPEGCWWLCCSSTATISSLDTPIGQHACYYSSLCQLSFMGDFFYLRVEPPADILCWCYDIFSLLSCSNMVAVCTNGGSTVWVCTTTTL